MSTYESPRELRRRVKDAANRADKEDLTAKVRRVSWLKDFGKEVFVELPNTLLLGIPKEVAHDVRALKVAGKAETSDSERPHGSERRT